MDIHGGSPTMSADRLKSNMGSENHSQLPLTEPLSPLVPQREVSALQEECKTLHLEVARLRSALDEEQAYRQQLEQECARERQKVERSYLDRQDYKQRLREAASAYAELKGAYHRLKTTAAPTANNNYHLATVAARTSIDATQELEEEELDTLEGSPTQEIPEEEQKIDVPLIKQPVILDNDVNMVEKEEEQEEIKEKVDEAPTADAVNTSNTRREVPPRSQVHKPEWKKAVRRRGDFEFNKDEDEEDAFLKPQAKKWIPDRSAAAAVAKPPPQQQQQAARPPIHRPFNKAKEAPQQQKQQQPRPNDGFKHQQVIRKREEREKLEGFECLDCKRFYDALEKWGAIAVGGIPQCQHRGNAAGEVGDDGSGASGSGAAGRQQQAQQANLRNELRANASRHRYLFEPPLTPQGFWDLGFGSPKKTDEEEQEQEAAKKDSSLLRPSSAPDSFS